MLITNRMLAIQELRECDHAFLSAEGVAKFAKAFDVKLTPYRAKANPKDPKGLTFANGAAYGVGMDAAFMAQQICHQLGVDYLTSYGRGSQLRFCCNALEKHFSK